MIYYIKQSNCLSSTPLEMCAGVAVFLGVLALFGLALLFFVQQTRYVDIRQNDVQTSFRPVSVVNFTLELSLSISLVHPIMLDQPFILMKKGMLLILSQIMVKRKKRCKPGFLSR